eukprot:3661597-Pyramimonas_sp.AAC.1
MSYAVGRGRYAGIGADKIADLTLGYTHCLNQFLAQCRNCQVTPLDKHRSQAYQTDNKNSEAGILGNRMLHACDAFSMAWHSGVHQRGPPPIHAPWAQGGLPHR